MDEIKRQWYVSTDGKKRTGPYSEIQLLKAAASGQIDKETLVWTQQLKEWKRAGDIQGLLPNQPPPLPGPLPLPGKEARLQPPGTTSQPATSETLLDYPYRLGLKAMVPMLLICIGCAGVFVQMATGDTPIRIRRTVVPPEAGWLGVAVCVFGAVCVTVAIKAHTSGQRRLAVMLESISVPRAWHSVEAPRILFTSVTKLEIEGKKPLRVIRLTHDGKETAIAEAALPRGGFDEVLSRLRDRLRPKAVS